MFYQHSSKIFPVSQWHWPATKDEAPLGVKERKRPRYSSAAAERQQPSLISKGDSERGSEFVLNQSKNLLQKKKKKDLLLSGTGCCTRLYNLPLLRPCGTGCAMSDGHSSFQSYFQMLSISPSDSQESAGPVCAFQTPRQLTPLPCPQLRLLR